MTCLTFFVGFKCVLQSAYQLTAKALGLKCCLSRNCNKIIVKSKKDSFILSNFLLLFHFSLGYICFFGLSFVRVVFVCLCFTCIRNVWECFFFACVYRLLLGASRMRVHYENLITTVFRDHIGDNWFGFFFLENECSLLSEKSLGVFFPFPCFVENTIGTSLWNIFGVFLQLASQTHMYDYFYFFFS